MSRIRSVHSTQWTDEAFCSCSPLARLLAIGLRNEADDNGIFEWNQFRLKIQILPVDNCDISALLDELQASNQILAYQVDGKDYGLIRNFHKFQRPKFPAFKYQLPTSSIALPTGYGFHPKAQSRVDDSPALPQDSGSPAQALPQDSGKIVAEVEERREEERSKNMHTDPASPDARASSSPSASTPVDPKKRLFDLGVSILTQVGESERTARSFLGKYAKQDETKLGEVLGYLAANPKIEPKGYIASAFKPKTRELVL